MKSFTDDAVPTADGVATKLATLVRLVVEVSPERKSDLSVAEAFKAFSIVQRLPSYWKVLRRRSIVKALAKRIDALEDILVLSFRRAEMTRAALDTAEEDPPHSNKRQQDSLEGSDCISASVEIPAGPAAMDSVKGIDEITASEPNSESSGSDYEQTTAASDSTVATPSFVLDEVKLVRLIGAGAFGLVWLVTWLGHEGYYALKMVGKASIAEEAQTVKEKDILSRLSGVPSAVQLLASSEDDDRHYLLFELALGGDLMTMINSGYWKWRVPGLGRRRPGIRLSSLKLYAAMLVLAVRQMHKHNIVHRDIKPDNIIVAANGYLKLADFGLAELVEPKEATMTVRGTIPYMAPEVAALCRGQHSPGAGRASDLWALGITLYEMRMGKESPFIVRHADGTSDRDATLAKIAAGAFSPPPELSGSFGDLINGLLDPNPRTRLGSEGGLRLEDHPYFKGINWERLAAQQVRAPWRPSGSRINRLPSLGLPEEHPALEPVQRVSVMRSCAGRINRLPGDHTAWEGVMGKAAGPHASASSRVRRLQAGGVGHDGRQFCTTR